MDTNVNIRKIELKDYEYIDKWWVEQGFIALDKSILPMNGLGGIIIEKNKPIAVGYLYLTNSKMGYIDNLIADPNYKSKDRFDIIIKLIQACKQMAKKSGCLEIWAITNSRGILQRCEALGYNITKANHAIISV
jgi:N-acetylglutamate synthase-like GNAT family acetyltransferase